MNTSGFGFSSLASRVLTILLLVFLITLAIVYFVIEQRAKPEVTNLASKAVIATGDEAVNGIMADLVQIDSLSDAAARLSESLPKDATLINTSIGHLFATTEDRVIGGGLWYDPTMYRADAEEQAFAWRRDKNGAMQPNPTYANINPARGAKSAVNVLGLTNGDIATPTAANGESAQMATPYYRDWWYVPAMYANHDHCVWSRAYIQADSKLPMVTCARAIFNPNTQGFEGVLSFDVLLENLQTTVKKWQDKTGGYAFLVDMNNNFLTFPDESLVKQVTQANPQGEMMDVSSFAQKHPNFTPIAQSLERINTQLIDKAKKMDTGRFEHISNNIVSSTNLQRTTQKEADILTALLFTNAQEDIDLSQEHFVERVALDDDLLLNQPSTAFVFSMPFINWKMVIVKPNSELVAFANDLGRQLFWWILLSIIPIMALSWYLVRRFATNPLRRVATEVDEMGELIERKRYTELTKHQLPEENVSEINTISRAMNNLIHRVVENEGALAVAYADLEAANEGLEQKVAERTEDLQLALKELKASQVQLVQSEKMATLGQMVAGVAHEVNTPLGYVRSNLDLIGDNLSRYDELVASTFALKALMADDAANHDDVEAALSTTLNISDDIVNDQVADDLNGLIDDAKFGVEQISELVVNLRDFSRLDQAKVKEVNINDCVQSSLTIARNNIKYLEVTTDLQATTPISCNPSQINQVLLNLFNNAAQAMPEQHQGKIHVKTYESTDDVFVDVADNGTGMPPEVIAKIFEPFFTTKAAGEGTGLGLAISTQIMEQHGGTLSVESEVGKGTCFTLRLPKQRAATQNTTSADQAKLLISE